MVTFVDGKKFTDGYRRFKIKTVTGSNDFAMMREVLDRRFKNPKWPHPNLILIDGGRGQLSIALRVLRDMGITGIDVIAIAKGKGLGARAKGEWKGKKSEEIFIPGRKNPIVLKPYAPELKLFQVIRDEAHRFAITYHRKLREKELTHSRLDDIAGIGPVLKARLIKHFGSPEAVLRASEEELIKVKGVTKAIAAKIHH